jgi:hypothetical protein
MRDFHKTNNLSLPNIPAPRPFNKEQLFDVTEDIATV